MRLPGRLLNYERFVQVVEISLIRRPFFSSCCPQEFKNFYVLSHPVGSSFRILKLNTEGHDAHGLSSTQGNHRTATREFIQRCNDLRRLRWVNDVNISYARAQQNLLGLNPYASQDRPTVDPSPPFIVGNVIRYPHRVKP